MGNDVALSSGTDARRIAAVATRGSASHRTDSRGSKGLQYTSGCVLQKQSVFRDLFLKWSNNGCVVEIDCNNIIDNKKKPSSEYQNKNPSTNGNSSCSESEDCDKPEVTLQIVFSRNGVGDEIKFIS